MRGLKRGGGGFVGLPALRDEGCAGIVGDHRQPEAARRGVVVLGHGQALPVLRQQGVFAQEGLDKTQRGVVPADPVTVLLGLRSVDRHRILHAGRGDDVVPIDLGGGQCGNSGCINRQIAAIVGKVVHDAGAEMVGIGGVRVGDGPGAEPSRIARITVEQGRWSASRHWPDPRE